MSGERERERERDYNVSKQNHDVAGLAVTLDFFFDGGFCELDEDPSSFSTSSFLKTG